MIWMTLILIAGVAYVVARAYCSLMEMLADWDTECPRHGEDEQPFPGANPW